MSDRGCPHRDICDAYVGTAYRGPDGIFRSDLEDFCDRVDRDAISRFDICPLYDELSQLKITTAEDPDEKERLRCELYASHRWLKEQGLLTGD